MSECLETIRENLSEVMDRIRQSATDCGRSADDVTLVAVTKYADLPWVQALIELGVVDLGENRPQQLVERAPLLSESVRWHMIGNLQRNKVKPVLKHSSMIHSIDSLKLLERVNRIADELQVRPRVLIEVNTSGEAAKGGFESEQLRSEWDQITEFAHVDIAGLMTMAPVVKSSEEARPYFAQLRELRDELQSESPDRLQLKELSMGMSGDFEAAILEGATIVRVGSRLYSELTRAEVG